MLPLILSLTFSAHGVPSQLTQQGRMIGNDGQPLNGQGELTFRIYDSETAGTVFWSETIPVNFTNGYFAAVLGANEDRNPLDSTVLSMYPLFLEVQLNDNLPMGIRHPINSTPYAQISGTAESLFTDVTIQTSDGEYLQIVDETGNWVGQSISVEWSDISPNSIPSDIADGDNDSQLSQQEVLDFVTGQTIDLGPNSSVNQSIILTTDSTLRWSNIDSIPPGITDGDDDTLQNISCLAGEILGYDGTNWVCVSDSTLTLSDIATMLSGNPVDLNASSTIGGKTFVTPSTDSDVINALGCVDGEIARYNQSNATWECSFDIDTVLLETDVENMVSNSALDLYLGSSVSGNSILTTADTLTPDWSNITNIPPDIDDGDDQLQENDVEGYITNDAIDLNVLTTIGGLDIVTPLDDSDTLRDLLCVNDGDIIRYDLVSDEWYCDEDSVLSESDVETYITNDSLNLASGTTIGGTSILTAGDTLTPDWNNLTSIPSDIADGDDNTQLSESDVETYITNGSLDFASGSTIGGNSVLTSGDTLTPDWNNLTSIPSDIADGDDNTQLSESDVETYITNGSLDFASGSTIGGNSVLTSADTLTPDWNNLTSVPSDIADGDDNTQLSESDVETYITNDSLNLASGSTVNGNSILTTGDTLTPDWNNLTSIPSDIADGDDNTQLSESDVETYITNGSLDFAFGSTIGGNSVLTSGDTLTPDWNNLTSIPSDIADGDDNTQLSESDVETYVTNDSLDLASGTTIGGTSILTAGDTLTPDWNNLTGIPSDIADGDDNTQLSESDVETYITNGVLDFASGSTIGGNSVLTSGDTLTPDWNNLTSIPSDIADGDDNTQLSESDVETYITNGVLDFASGSTVNGNSILTTGDTLTPDWNNLTSVPSDIADGDDNTQLSESDVETYITNASINLASNSKVNGDNILTTGSTLTPSWSNITGIPSNISDGDSDALSSLSCSSGQVAKWNGSAWACASDNDTDTNTTYNGSNFALSNQSCPSGQKMTGINSSGTITCSADDGIPSGMIAFFIGSCPSGFSEYTAMRGRAVVGMPSSGTAAGTVGSAFSDLGTRTISGVPSHNHSVNPPSTASTSGGRHSHSVNPPSTASTSTGSHNHSVDPPNTSTTAAGSHNHDFYTANHDTNSASSQGYPAGNSHLAFRTTDRRQRTEDSGTIQSVGSHSHSMNISSFNSGSNGSHSHTTDIASFTSGTESAHSHAVDIASFNSGSTGSSSVDVTMPYIQLTACVAN